jgi:predicted RNA binding protein YcfA (HicA-like mRNA interferase family)
MSQRDKLLLKILRGTSDADIPFDQLCQLLKRLGFEQRIRGSHHIFYMDGIEEILNLQPKKQGKGKAYQVKQVRNLILKYKLGDQDEN